MCGHNPQFHLSTRSSPAFSTSFQAKAISLTLRRSRDLYCPYSVAPRTHPYAHVYTDSIVRRSRVPWCAHRVQAHHRPAEQLGDPRARDVRQRGRQRRRTGARPRPRCVRQIREDGVSREVLRVSRATEPIDVAMLVDNSAAARDDITFLRKGSRSSWRRWPPATTSRSSRSRTGQRSSSTTPTTPSDSRMPSGACSPCRSGMTLLDAIFETSQGLARRETPAPSSFPSSPTASSSPTATPTTSSRHWSSVDAALHMVTIGQFHHSEEHGDRERSFLLAMARARRAASASRCSVRTDLTTRCNGWRASCLAA